MYMRNVLFTIALILGLAACSNGKANHSAEYQQAKKNVVEVLYFHGAQRCATCMAIEKNAKELVETAYAKSLKKGELVFRSVDISQEKALAEKHEVSWSSLILVDYDKHGNEKATNLTEFAFGNARTAPEKFKSELSEQLSQMLND